MGKKKLNSLEGLREFVFSTNDDFEYEHEKEEATLSPENQYLEALFSNKGRAGKTVTIIKGFSGTERDLKTLAKMLKTRCGVGGSVKDYEILIQGNYRDKIMEILTKEGYHVKRVGG